MPRRFFSWVDGSGQFASRLRRPISRNKRELRLSVEQFERRDLLTVLVWEPGVALPAARAGGSAVETPSQSILVIGGGTTTVNSLSSNASAWGTANPIDIGRVYAGVGSIGSSWLVYGGTRGETLSATLTYDPANSDNVQDASPMHTARTQFGYATDGGAPYAIGGHGSGTTILSSVERYNAALDSWSNAAPLPQARFAFAAVDDGAGHIYTFGGATANSASSVSNTVYCYTVATNSWQQVASMPVATRDSAAVLASNGKIYVIGGSSGSATLATVQSYDPSTDTWTIESDLPAPVSDAAAVTDALGRIEVIGGFDQNQIPLSTVSVSQMLNQPDVAPTITSTPAVSVLVNSTYTYQVAASGNPAPTFSLLTAPSGASVGTYSGTITWTPTYADEAASPDSFTIQAANYVGSASQTFSVAIAPQAPTGLTAAGTSTSTIGLTWDASPDPNVVSYKVYSRTFIHDPRGSGGSYHYTLLGTATGNSFTVGGLGVGKGGTYLVSAVNSAGVESARSAPASATTWSPASFPQGNSVLLSSGAVWGSPVPATAGQTTQVTLLGAGNPAPTYSIVSGPSTASVDPNTGVVTYTPDPSEVGLVAMTFEASNVAGSATVTVEFQVSPPIVAQTPVITWPTPSDIVYGTTLDSAELNATATDPVSGLPVSGTFSYSPDFGTLLNAGVQTLTVTFTPSDTIAYTAASGSTTLNVLPATPYVLISGGPFAYNGLSHAATATVLGIDGVTPVAGTLVVTYNGSPAPPTAAGSYSVEADFASGDPNYANTSATGTLIINPAVQLLADPQNPALTDLVWTGTAGADHVRFDQVDATTIRVTTTEENGLTTNDVQTFTGVTGSVLASGDAGNDTLDARGLLTTPATLDGGAGNNTILGGQAGDILIGGSNGGEGQQGSNTIIAGNGDNTIYGNAPAGAEGSTGGNNIIVGGWGNDTIYGTYGIVYKSNGDVSNGAEGGHNIIVGGGGGDAIYASQLADGAEGGHGSILIAGRTTLDQAALSAVMSEWASADSYATKIADISGTGSGGANGANYLQPGATVSHNGSADYIYGDTNGSLNWVLYTVGQDIASRTKPGEVLTNV